MSGNIDEPPSFHSFAVNISKHNLDLYYEQDGMSCMDVHFSLRTGVRYDALNGRVKMGFNRVKSG